MKAIIYCLYISLVFIFSLFAQEVDAKNKNLMTRYEIDAKRIGVNIYSEEALPRGKEFIRLDSSYYVGWFFDGYFKFRRSADMQGLKNASVSLQKAYQLLLQEHEPIFQKMFSSQAYFDEHRQLFIDLLQLCSALTGCYENLEMPNAALDILNKIESYGFQTDLFIDDNTIYSFNTQAQKAWIYHRNRFFTNKKFSFLKHSIQANTQAAFTSCYQGLYIIEKNKTANDKWFGEAVSLYKYLGIIHNLAILHSYAKNYDSSLYYYRILEEHEIMSKNNFAGLQYELGNFSEAEKYYLSDIEENNEVKHLQEPYYFLPQLYIISGKTPKAIGLNKEIITKNGSRPGFGWYNIALAKGYLYNGQLDSCSITLEKARNFKEVHIGTTLTQAQYDFSINLLNVQLLYKKIKFIKFQHSNWWYSPSILWEILKLKIALFIEEYNTALQLSLNPDKNRMVYDLFCSEATTSFDEAWYLLKNFSSDYFIRMYKTYESQDKRTRILPYFQLFQARFQLENGNRKTGKKALDTILQTTHVDTTYEKLFIGRIYESILQSHQLEASEEDFYINELYTIYPQLIPFSDLNIKMNLKTTGISDPVTQQIIKDLQTIKITWSSQKGIPSAHIHFEKREGKYKASITTNNAQQYPVVVDEELYFSKAKHVGKEIAIRLFGKNGASLLN